MPPDQSNLRAAGDRFWQWCSRSARKIGVKEHVLRGCVRHADAYPRRFSRRRPAQHTAANLAGRLEPPRRLGRTKDSEFVQIVDAGTNPLAGGFFGPVGKVVVAVVLVVDQTAVLERPTGRAGRRHRWRGRSGSSPAAATGSRRGSRSARLGPRVDATGVGRRHRGTGGPRSAAVVRAGVWARCDSAPSRPAIDRGSGRRRRTGSRGCARRAGRPGSGTAFRRRRDPA